MKDRKGQDLALGDRVIPVHWGEIPLWLSNTKATVVGFGRTRVWLHFDSMTYRPGDRPHAINPGSVRKI